MMIGHGMAGLMISSAVGYWVLTQSEKEKNRMRKLGQYLGFGIILISVFGIACKVYYGVKACQAMGGGMMCPFPGKSAPPAK